jgi:hypothetical protein
VKRLFWGLIPIVLSSCVSSAGIKEYGWDNNYYNFTVNYLVKNFSNDKEWTVIVYKDVLGDVEEELYIEADDYWSKDIVFRINNYEREHLSLVAHSLYGTFETTITIKEINRSISSGSRIKKSGMEYYSLSQMFIDGDTIDLFNNLGNDIIRKWAGEKRRRMPKRFFLSGCTG